MAGGRVFSGDRRLDTGAAGADPVVLRVAAVARCAAGARREDAQGRVDVVHEPGLGRRDLLRAEGPDAPAAAVPGGAQRPRRHPDERVVVDPNAIDPSGETTIDWFVPSPDGARVAVSLSEHGTEDGTLHVFDVATGEVVGDRSRTSTRWAARWPGARTVRGSGTPCRAGPRRASTRRCGSTSSADARRPAGARRRLRRGSHRGELPVRVARRALGDGPRAEGRRRRVADLRAPAGGRRRGVADGRRHRRRVHPRRVRRPTSLFLLSLRGAPRGQVLRLRADARRPSPTPTRSCRRAISPSRRSRRPDARLWVVDIDGGPQQLRAFDHDGRPLPPGDPAGQLGVVVSARLARLGPARSRGRWRRSSRRRTWWVHADDDAAPSAPRWTRPRRSTVRASRSSACSRPPRTAPESRSTSSPRPARRGTARPRRCFTATAASRSRSSRRSSPSRLLWLEQRRGRTPSRTSAAAASTAGSGTTPAGSRPSRTASTTSWPAPTTSSRRGITSRELPGDHGRLQRRAADGRRAHPAPGPRPRRRRRRAGDGLAALRAHDERRASS